MILPSFLGLGMSRSGTRWLAQCLAEHPEVFLPPEEVHYFVRKRMISTWSRGPEWYSSLFAGCAHGRFKAWGEISPSYLADEEAADLIRQFAPDVKLICSLRDQSEWFYSAYRLFLRFNPELFHTSYSFHTFLVYAPQMFREVLYLEHIKRYLGLFPKDQLMILIYDDLRMEPEVYIRRIYRFLGVDDSFVPPSVGLGINPMELVTKRSWTLHRIAERASSNWPAFGRIARVLDRMNTITVDRDDFPERHRLTAELRARIWEIYSNHNRELGEFLGRDLSHWNKPK
jgi:Sulfotransferase domain